MWSITYSIKKKSFEQKKCHLGFDAIKNRGPDFSVSKYFLNNKLFVGNTILQVTGKIDKKNYLHVRIKGFIFHSMEKYIIIKI